MRSTVPLFILVIARLALPALSAMPAGPPLVAQTLDVSPNPAMVDESVAVRATGLQPGERVTIQAELIYGADAHWSSEATFIADAQGGVDTSIEAPVGGSYKEVSAPALIWSMRPASKNVAIYREPREAGPQAIDFHLIRNGQPAASVTLRQLRLGPGVRRVQMQGGLHGFLFLPGVAVPRPAVLVLGGSEGGVPLEKARWLASRGYVAFALAYFRYENLPKFLEGIPLEYLGSAITWLAKRPEVEPDYIGVMGTSRGGELALQLGSTYPELTAVVAYVPANVRHQACCGGTDLPYAWTVNGQPLPYVRMRGPGDPVVNADPTMIMRAEIPVEKTHGPILMIGAEDDDVWESARMVTAAAARLKKARFAYEVEVLKYSHARHRAGLPEIIPAWHGAMIHPVSGQAMNFGGSPQGDAASSLDAIPKVLEFLRKSLDSGEAPADATLRLRLAPANSEGQHPGRDFAQDDDPRRIVSAK